MAEQELKPEDSASGPRNGSTAEPNDVATIGGRPKRTTEEQRLLDASARMRGRPLTEQEENLILDEARFIGNV